MDNHVNPNGPDEEAHHHAFLVETGEFNRAAEILMARNIRIVKYSNGGHQSFPGSHVYFHDVDGNAIEISSLYV
jgi:catechol 2,3-dioxygenase-like lactoylglutathione lyase family enzyme